MEGKEVIVMEMGIKVKEIMRRNVVTVEPGETVLETAKKMREEDVGSVIVIENNKPVGIVTREDIVTKVTAEDKQPSEIQVKEIMNSPVITCGEEDDLSTVANVMNKYGYERLPVVDKNGNLKGIVSVREILGIAPGLIEVFKERLATRIEEDISGMESAFTQEKEDETMEGECEICGNYSEDLRKINGVWMCQECAEKEGLASEFGREE